MKLLDQFRHAGARTVFRGDRVEADPDVEEVQVGVQQGRARRPRAFGIWCEPARPISDGEA